MHGGLLLASHKERSTAKPLTDASVPNQLRFSAPTTTDAVVKLGDAVRVGQLLIAGSQRIHASVSGVVSALHSEYRSILISIDNDGRDTPDAAMRPIDDFSRLAPDELRVRIAEAGIVGLGGATYSTAAKLQSAADKHAELLIVNCAECEPFIACDDALLRAHADDVALGAQALLHASGATTALFAIESNKREAIAALDAALKASGDSRLALRIVPTLYPTGGERQLVQLLTAREVPSGGFPPDIGVLCQNAGTAGAIARMIRSGEPLIRRVVTVTGSGVNEPRNLLVRIGTPIASLIADCGGYCGAVERLIMGGSMMGVALPSDEICVSAATNCIVAATRADLAQRRSEMPCIRCGDCARACPAGLLPQQLLRYARLNDRAALNELGLRDCIECGCCDYVCPSNIPLVAQFIAAKQS